MNEIVSNPISVYIEAFLNRLRDEQHAETTIKAYSHCLEALTKGIRQQSVALKNLTPELAHSLVQLKAANSRYRLNRFMRFLGENGACAPLPAPSDNEVIRAALRAEFETYLREQRGVSEGTIQHASYMARRFLEYTFGEGPDLPDRITPVDITGFLRKLLDRKSPTGTRRSQRISARLCGSCSRPERRRSISATRYRALPTGTEQGFPATSQASRSKLFCKRPGRLLQRLRETMPWSC